MSKGRNDRGTPNSDNERNFYRSKSKEPTTREELIQQKMNAIAKWSEVKIERDEWKQKAQNNEAAAIQLLDTQQQLQLSEARSREIYLQTEENYRLYLKEQEQYQAIFNLYNQEQTRSTELLIQYQEANTLKLHYLAKYDELQTKLKAERQSKASIKGWQTRRKNENERLKQQIGDMVILLRDSLERKEESINHLYLIGDRMDRIQRLMDSVEQESNRDPVKLLEKLMRVWLVVQKILAE
jgi:hypothetical protein